MQSVINFLYRQNPIKYIFLVLISTFLYLYYNHYEIIMIILTIIGEIIYMGATILLLLCIIDGQPINTNKYTGTIYADQSATNFEPIYVAYFNKYWTAKLSINIRIWLIKHFDMKNKSSPIVYIIANECL